MVKRIIFKCMAIMIVLMLFLQIAMPTIYNSYATEENEITNDITSTENNEDRNIVEDNITTNEDDNNETHEEPIIVEMNSDMPLVGSASGGGANAGNEGEFSGLFYNTGVGELTIQSTIRLNNSYTVNHNLRIDSSSQSGANSLQLSSGCRIVVPANCVLTLDEVVIDGRTFGNNDGKSCITVQNGGVLMLTRTLNY